MKKGIILFFLALSCAGHAAAPDVGSGSAHERDPLVFATCISDPYQENLVGMLIDSIREFGGRYRNAPVYVAVADPANSYYEYLERRSNVVIVPLQLDEAILQYPYAPKAYAAARVEEMTAGKAGSLAWFDPETLLLKPPTHFELPKGISLAVRPVHIQNVGLLEQDEPDNFWSAILKETGAEARQLFGVGSVVDSKRLKAYLNCGIFAVRPELGLLREWAKVMDRLLRDAEFQSAACSDRRHRIFLHQAILTGVIVAKVRRANIRLLPDDYGYPLHLHTDIPARKKAKRLNDVTTLHYESIWSSNPGWMTDLIPMDGALREWLKQAYLRTLNVSGPIYREEGSCNSYLVKTAEGNVIIDPGGASRPSSWLRVIQGEAPVKAILLTHAHDDHRTGILTWKRDAGAPVVGQEEMVEFLRYQDRLRGFLEHRRASQTGKPLDSQQWPDGAETPVEATILYRDQYRFDLGGLSFQLFHTGGETPDQSVIWIPELKAVFIGDNYYTSFPNLYTLRGTEPRWALEYVAALNKALSLEPEILLPGHDEPVRGKELIRRKVTRYRDAILYVHDAVVAGMNEGKSAFDLMREIQLPPELRLPEFYGRVSWSVRGIYEGYAGWFDENPATMYDLSPASVYGELLRLSGGGDSLAARALELVREGDPVRALHLTDVVLSVDPTHAAALDAHLQALKLLQAKSHNYIERGWLSDAIRKIETRPSK